MVKNFEKLKNNWSNILLQMKEDFEISDHIYNAFIKDIMTPVKLEKDTLYIEVPEEGYISFLQNELLSSSFGNFLHSKFLFHMKQVYQQKILI